jgi:hypothetical protein
MPECYFISNLASILWVSSWTKWGPKPRTGILLWFSVQAAFIINDKSEPVNHDIEELLFHFMSKNHHLHRYVISNIATIWQTN